MCGNAASEAAIVGAPAPAWKTPLTPTPRLLPVDNGWHSHPLTTIVAPRAVRRRRRGERCRGGSR
eukprot:4081030-Prymnesium_polylepis.3